MIDKEDLRPNFLRDSDAIGDLPLDIDFDVMMPKTKPTLQDKQKIKDRVERYLKNNPGAYNSGLINDMQQCGMPRPDWIPAADWNINLQEMKPLHHLICYMACYGMPPAEIAKNLGKSAHWVSTFLRTQDAQALVFDLQHKIFGMEPKKWIEKVILPSAIQVALDIMNDKEVKAQTRLNAAMRFMDHGLGKPKQELEVHDSTIRVLIEKLDEMDRKSGGKLIVSDVIDVSEVGRIQLKDEMGAAPEQKAEPSLDCVDTWVQENLDA